MAHRLGMIVFALLCASLFGQTNVNYTQVQTFSGGFAPKGIAIGDITGGPLPDICLLDTAAREIHVIGNNGLATLPTEFGLVTSALSGNGPTSIAFTDMDGDGDADIVFGGALAGVANAGVFLHQGGSYVLSTATMNSALAIHVADLDGDGRKDLVRGARYALATAASPGIVTFGLDQALPVAGIPSTAVTSSADVNGDGRPDILWTASSGSSILLWAALNTTTTVGSPSFAVPSAVTVGHLATAASFAAADMNNDGIQDVVTFAVGTQSQSDLEVQTFLGTAAGVFIALPPIAVCAILGIAPVPVLKDIDGDGWTDAIIRYDEAPIGGFAAFWVNVIRRLKNDGQGRLTDAAVISSATSATTIGSPNASHFAVGDLDLDGDLDICRQSSLINGLLPNQVPLGINNDVLLAALAPATAAVAQSITIVSGDNRVVPTSLDTDSNFIVDVRDAQGQPVAGVPIALNVGVGAASLAWFTPCATMTSDATGRASFAFRTTSIAGPMTIDAILPNGATATFHINVFPLTVVKISGDNQSLAWNSPTAQPLVVEVRDPSGTPVPNVFVSFQGFNIGFNGPATAYTDALGRAQATPLVTTGSGAILVSASVTPSMSTTFTVNVQPLTVAILGGDNQATDLDDAFPETFRVRITDANAMPAIGTGVSIYATGALAVPSATQAVTDGAGEVAFTAHPAPNAQGAVTIWVQAEFGGALVQFHVFARRLVIGGSAAFGSVSLAYYHEHGPQALVLTVDVPQPGVVSTVYGNLYTSILAPGPAFFAADPAGQFGAADPGLYATPTFTRTYGIPASVAGYTFVTQILGFDPLYYPDIGRSVFFSNGVTKTL